VPSASVAVTHPRHEPPRLRSGETTPRTQKPPRPPDCTHPYVLDAEGNKRYKPECL